jgi:alkanesulfonate monooxygenase SsuD/methylene tetrahydromethanopterin reductase-like flavin-dependent oxidoreductase (luciferase family)
VSAVKVGAFLPASIGRDPITMRRALDRLAAAGLDHVGTADHISFHTGWGIDGIVEATALAMLHPALSVYIGVYLLPLRHPVPVARQLATLGEHAPGRVSVGLGVGGEDRHEVEICGVDPATRGRRMDEHLLVLRGLLSGERVTHHGEFVDVVDAVVAPRPERVPLIVGGRAPAALARAGRLGDGWLGIWSTPESYARRLAIVSAAAAECGRASECVDHGLQLWCGFGADGRGIVAGAMESFYRVPFEKFERFTPVGSPTAVAASLQPYVDAGCRSFNVAAHAASWDEAVDGLGEVRSLLNR